MQYSDIFSIYKTSNNDIFYNILKKIQLPDDKTSELYITYIVSYDIPWTLLSYKIYGNIKYYWLIQLANIEKKLNPLYVSAGTKIYIINSIYLDLVIEHLNKSINEN